MSLYPELDNLDLDELIARFHGPPLDGEAYARAYYDEVAVRIGQQGAAGQDFLLGEIKRADADRLGAIFLAFTFVQPEPASVQDILVSHLHDSRPWVVARAVDALWLLGKKDAMDAVLALREHASPYVRASVLEFLSHLDPEAALPALLAALHDPDYIVRARAVDALDDMGAVEALPALQPLLADPHPHVRQATEGALRRLNERVYDHAAQGHEVPLS